MNSNLNFPVVVSGTLAAGAVTTAVIASMFVTTGVIAGNAVRSFGCCKASLTTDLPPGVWMRSPDEDPRVKGWDQFDLRRSQGLEGAIW